MRPGPDARFEAQNLVSTNVPGVVKYLAWKWDSNCPGYNFQNVRVFRRVV